jgi:undecaprenyl diphosphate synthase
MDGNGRWAQKRGLPRLAGHRAGTEKVRLIVEACADAGIEVVTVYAFSTENWSRPEAEVRGLFRIMADFLSREMRTLHATGVQIHHLGKLDGVSDRLKRAILEGIELTKDNKRITLNVAFNYGGRAEIVEAVRRLLADGIPPAEITESRDSQYLYTDGQPDPDLVIRTAGEMRLSNFLIWQAAYAEYYSTPVYWPDFDVQELHKALAAFGQRERRFGKVKPSA